MALDNKVIIGALGEQCGDVTLQCSDVAGYLNLVNAKTQEDLARLAALQHVMDALQSNQRENTQAASELMSTAQHAQTMIVEGHRAAADSLSHMAMLIEQVTGLDDKLRAFLSIIEAVGGISEELSGIVKQSRTLGFNAALEASRGGAAAQGFAVVADEMRRLASMAGDSASSVGARLSELDRNARALIEGVEGTIAKGRSTTMHIDSIRAMMEEFAALITQFRERSNAIVQCTQAAGEGVTTLEGQMRLFNLSATENAERIGTARARIDDLESFANQMLNSVAHGGIETRNSRYIALALDGAREVSTVIKDALARGSLGLTALFDTAYRDVPGSDPAQYLNDFVPFADAQIRPLLDRHTQQDPAIVGCCLIDMSGFLPTHISERSQRQRSGERQWNLENCRNRQRFMDNQTRRALRNDGAFFLNTYRQDFGDGNYRALRSVFVPLEFEGRRWGLYEVGYLI